MNDEIDNSHVEFEDEPEESLDEMYLTFMLAEDEFGINISYVTEIIGILAITFVPDLPVFVKGIINLRGQIIPVIDVRLRFQKDPMDYNDRTCVIVLQIKDLSIGFIVDSVASCCAIPHESVIEPPVAQRNFHQKYVSGIGRMTDKIVQILNCEKLISEDTGIEFDVA
ncbi:MAG: chemotaxis protein CheW [Oscillospiraceae bacterium]|nr:chemotaxis protein CheW [Oscillospiraceae bacterium]